VTETGLNYLSKKLIREEISEQSEQIARAKNILLHGIDERVVGQNLIRTVQEIVNITSNGNANAVHICTTEII
jgi:hypothetical protein